MGCVASKLEEEEEAVSICRERKRLLKSAVDRRYALANAHCKYIHSLYAVAAAIQLFVARHSSPSSPFLITQLPHSPSLPSGSVSDLRPTPSDSTQEAITARQSSSSSSDEEETVREEEEEEEEEEGEDIEEGEVCRYFYTVPPPAPAPAPASMDFGWDFFNPFDGVREAVMGGFSRSSDEDLRVVREEEGIPELEDEEERERGERKMVAEDEEGEEEEEEEEMVVVRDNGVGVVKVTAGGGANVSRGEQKGLTVIDTPVRERELLEALKDVEDHFIRAYDSGKDVSMMLEADRVHFQSGLEEIKENSSKIIHAITWHRSSSSQSSSYKSSLASSSKDNKWKQFNSNLFDDYGGMESGSHSLTLGRLYAWEKKLYDEVKAGDRTRKIYERKLSQLRNKDARGDDSRAVDKTRTVVKDLYTRIWVAIRTAESISKRIQKLRDEELQPQLAELLAGLLKTWNIMLESHETQNQIMFEVNSFTSSTYGKFCSDSHRLATLQLEAELENWRTSFTGYIAAQRAYIEALDGWLSKFIVPNVEYYTRGRSSIPSFRVGGPPLVVICHDWLTALEKLPDKAVTYAMKSFRRDVKALWVQQGEEQQQKRKVDSLAKELDRRVLAFQRAENGILESKLSELKSEPDMRQRVEYLAGRKDLLDMFRKRLDLEKEKHHDCMQETQRITLKGFQTGFTSVFESMTEFSKASLNMYAELVDYSEKVKAADEKGAKPSYIEGSQVEVDSK